jgi:hypothetical protein
VRIHLPYACEIECDHLTFGQRALRGQAELSCAPSEHESPLAPENNDVTCSNDVNPHGQPLAASSDKAINAATVWMGVTAYRVEGLSRSFYDQDAETCGLVTFTRRDVSSSGSSIAKRLISYSSRTNVTIMLT